MLSEMVGLTFCHLPCPMPVDVIHAFRLDKLVDFGCRNSRKNLLELRLVKTID